MDTIKIYLDNCCFNRPYDDQSYLSIFMETQAKLAIQDLINESIVKLVWSFILDYENSVNPDESIKHEIFCWRGKADCIIQKNNDIIKSAKFISENGFGKKDALHIASALDAGVDYFITVDKAIIKKRDAIYQLKICSPIDFISVLEGKENEN